VAFLNAIDKNVARLAERRSEKSRMDLNQKKEQFSNAFIHAIAAVAGYATAKPSVDDDSIDWTVSQKGGNGALRSPKLDLQLKCTGNPDFDEDNLRFPLVVKNYDELRPDNVQVPRILVVVTVPMDITEWLILDEGSLALRHCAYWLSLRGRPATQNEETVTVHLPRIQRFDPAALAQIMNRIGNGDPP
jgi:hypothetical protein